MFHLDPPPGFQGLREDLPVTTYKRNLPHWRQDGATYFVTFRLHDAIPVAQQGLLRDRKAFWERKNPPPHTDEQLEELSRILETELGKWLDKGLGSCLLRSPANRNCLKSVLHFFDQGQRKKLGRINLGPPRFDLSAWVMMPNHVHLLVQPLEPQRWTLEKILQSWKRQSARDINRTISQEGAVWLDESHDRLVRDAEHLWKCLQYIGRNPFKVNLPDGHFDRWVRPEWAELGWNFNDE